MDTRTTLTINELYVLRDACLHAHSHSVNQDARNEYLRLFAKLGEMITITERNKRK